MNEHQNEQELLMLCNSIRALVIGDKYVECKALLSGAMRENPDSPELHRLMGIVLANAEADQYTIAYDERGIGRAVRGG